MRLYQHALAATKWVCITFLLLTLPVPWGSIKTSAGCELVQTLFSATPKKNGKKRSGHARLCVNTTHKEVATVIMINEASDEIYDHLRNTSSHTDM